MRDSDSLLDVLIVGAGLSGIGAAGLLRRRCPGQRLAIVEARAALGGTWDLFRYPGVRSDSDMYTLGYADRPWTDPRAIAAGPAIRRYIEDTADAHGLGPLIGYRQRAVRADWSSADACWQVRVADLEHGAEHTVRTRFLYLCSGYYNYNEAYRPRFAGEDAFRGRIVQPQFWPADLDYTGQRVVVVGSGATAVTLVPAMAGSAAQVTMLQRSPTYIVRRPGRDALARLAAGVLPARVAYGLTRWKNILEAILLYRLARARPQLVRDHIIRQARKELGPGADAAHFTPAYQPWDQRVCVAPDGDFFAAVRAGRAQVVTDHIECFTPGGIRLASGRELAADLVVMATGLELQAFGGMQVAVDGRELDPHAALAYKGMMLSDVPNFALAFGYTNASWTLKADLTAAYVCRLLRYMARHGYAIAVPRREPDVTPQPLLNFTSGYVQRGLARLPQQGSRRPWQVYQNYLQDLLTIRYGRLADGIMRFGAKGSLP